MDIQKQWSTKDIPIDLIFIKQALFDPYNFKITQPILETESTAYGACTFQINELNIQYRNAKITPTKTGQFVTLWKRINKNPIQPFDASDPIDLFIISCRKGKLLGQFIFPKSILIEKGILSYNIKEGKRALRVYPSWDITTNKQAQKTQKWQLDYFLEFQENKYSNIELAKKLYTPKSI